MIEFKNVSIKFKHKKNILSAVENVSFGIKKGEIFGIAGSSGAGKSTLLRTINLLQPVSSGDVFVDGELITHYKGKKLREHRRKIGMIFQHFNLADNLTVFENIAFVLKTAGKSKQETNTTVREYLSLVGLSDKIDVYPSNLSGGQKQRVAIARALVGGAQILLCDEPTSALDVETTVSILGLIQSLSVRLGITVVIITHELDVIKTICSRCAVMNHGKLVEIDDVYTIFTNPANDYTKQLIGHTQKFELPENIINNIKGKIFKLTFHEPHANTPVISDVTELFGVKFNILLGRIEYISEKPLGVLYVNPTGDEKAIGQSLVYMEKILKKVEVVHNARV
ncbi:MAG: ATP-binding cassette domain-containing protein [Campylobacteraceae bacterium]|jgi:D-methionine transport system ATP-binding protein|nr:ATP-binding cassette domain-containing protein [Campylobacteraceae bacterium]